MIEELVIIPSARLVPIELQAEFGPIPTAMIPVDGQPALLHILAQYPASSHVIIDVDQGAEEVSSYVEHHLKKHPISLVNVGSTSSLGETILCCLQAVTTQPKHLIINFGDTALTGNPELVGDFINYAQLDEVYRWTTFCADNQGRITAIDEKNTDKSLTNGKSMAFIGVFGFQDSVHFTKCLAGYVEQKGDVDPFYRALQLYSSTHPFSLAESHGWLDFGHLDTYYESRKQISSGCREFNVIEVDSLRGRLTKTSRNFEKFRQEISWYLKLPTQLQHIAPRVFSYQLESPEPSIELEFYGYPVLNDLYLYGHLDAGAWTRIFKSVEQSFTDMKNFHLPEAQPDECLKSCREMYEFKTLQRMQVYMKSAEFAWSHDVDLTINGSRTLPLSTVADTIPGLLEKAGLYSDITFSIIHGDPCFSNILYDRRNGIVRFIDPRGCFGSHDIYGDPRYDWAKLNHSIEGDYDFMVNGLFDFEMINDEVTLKPHLTARHHAIKELYRERMERKFGQTEHMRIRLLESLLFLSMIPLHADRPRSQQAFLARGLELFTMAHRFFEK